VIFLQNRRDRLVFYPPFLRAVLRTPRKRIRLAVLRSWSVVDAKVDAGELLCPARLSAVEYFCCSEVLKVLVVRKDLHLVGRAFAVSLPMFECIDDCEEFLVLDFVIDLRRLELPGVEGYRV